MNFMMLHSELTNYENQMSIWMFLVFSSAEVLLLVDLYKHAKRNTSKIYRVLQNLCLAEWRNLDVSFFLRAYRVMKKFETTRKVVYLFFFIFLLSVYF